MEKFKVRIESANPNNWYAHMIGETIEVIDHNTVQYYAVNETGLILKSDCTIIDPIHEKVEPPKVGESWECVKDVIMYNGSIKFIEGRVYKCEADRCLTNETGNKYHGVFALEDDMDDDPNFITDHFRKIEPALTAPVDVQEVERLAVEAYPIKMEEVESSRSGQMFDANYYDREIFKEGCNAIIKHITAAQQPSQWVEIKSEKDLPVDMQEVLCCSDAMGVPVMSVFENGQFKVQKYAADGERTYVAYWSDITHWMPLPTKPIK